MKFFICSVLFFSVTFVAAQEIPPILETNKPKIGIYTSFEEFLNDEPSIHTPFQVLCKSDNQKIERGTADYKLLVLDSTTKKRELYKYWGVCDGENIYINEVVYGGFLNLKKIHGLGRYCYFMGSRVDSYEIMHFSNVSGGFIGGALAAAAIEIDGDYPYILNINNGKIFLLDKNVLKIILESDEGLSDLYNEENRKSNKNLLLSYLAKYNNKHQEEIKYNEVDPFTLIFYRKDKKEKAELLTINIGDSVLISLKPNSLQQMEWLTDSVEACFESNCTTILLDKDKPNYIECSWREEEVKIEKVKDKVGEFYDRVIRKQTEQSK